MTMAGDGERHARQSFDVLEISSLAGIAERYGRSSGTGPRRAADAMHVALRLVG